MVVSVLPLPVVTSPETLVVPLVANVLPVPVVTLPETAVVPLVVTALLSVVVRLPATLTLPETLDVPLVVRSFAKVTEPVLAVSCEFVRLTSPVTVVWPLVVTVLSVAATVALTLSA